MLMSWASQKIITLTTDFGTRDTFVAEMKGVILSINPSVTIIDMTHEIEPFDIIDAALKLGSAVKYFPPGTIHIAVVDPGVGSPRRPIIIKTESYYFVGPDNGIFTLALENEKNLSIYEITIPVKGPTFHGRDLFAPVGARLSLGEPPDVIGREIMELTKIEFPEPEVLPFQDKNFIKGKVIIIDRFGNAITNIKADLLSSNKFRVTLSGREIPVFNFYREAEGFPGGAVINSSGYLEIFKYRGSAATEWNIKRGDSVEVILEG